LYDAPLLIYSKGTGDINSERMLGVVGTRKATEYGKIVCDQIAFESKSANIQFVSGLAFGIDASIHQSCVDLGIPNFAVLAGGFQYIYPYQHRKLAESILESGAWISEHPPHIKPDARYFPMRNRIIAGLTDALIVVEAANRGGALITADYANNYNREVFAVPGMINKPYSDGCNQLILDNKAILFRSMTQLYEQMNWNQKGEIVQKKLEFDYSRFTQNESSILAALHQLGELSMEELSWKTAIPLKEIALITINLEFNGMIKAIAGNRYRLN
jgi:DNA processing protein